jgi:glycosyltransferase EpsE
MEAEVSVITPAFNAERTIVKAVDSIRKQTYNAWEHIIVDDGSTDSTWLILSTLASNDNRLKIFHQENAKQAAARNNGINLSKGRYIALLDADDCATPERLQTQIKFLEEHPEVDVLGGGIINVTLEGERVSTQYLAEEHYILSKNIYRLCPFFTSTVMARRSYFENLGGFNVDLSPAEDYDLWLRGHRDYTYHNLQVPLAFYYRIYYPRLSYAIASSRVLIQTISRDKRLLTCSWYALRPLVSSILNYVKILI